MTYPAGKGEVGGGQGLPGGWDYFIVSLGLMLKKTTTLTAAIDRAPVTVVTPVVTNLFDICPFKQH